MQTQGDPGGPVGRAQHQKEGVRQTVPGVCRGTCPLTADALSVAATAASVAIHLDQ
jgi:hypothetical protein